MGQEPSICVLLFPTNQNGLFHLIASNRHYFRNFLWSYFTLIGSFSDHIHEGFITAGGGPQFRTGIEFEYELV